MKSFQKLDSNFNQKGCVNTSMAVILFLFPIFTQIRPEVMFKQFLAMFVFYGLLLAFYLPTMGFSIFCYRNVLGEKYQLKLWLPSLCFYPTFALSALYLGQAIVYFGGIHSFTFYSFGTVFQIPHIIYSAIFTVYFFMAPLLNSFIQNKNYTLAR
ncbi:hypothetical protein MJH12_08340, partial [bacterium]|nr:hypothetical protein [bacterium]